MEDDSLPVISSLYGKTVSSSIKERILFGFQKCLLSSCQQDRELNTSQFLLKKIGE